jgi:hypothetical protein
VLNSNPMQLGSLIRYRRGPLPSAPNQDEHDSNHNDAFHVCSLRYN